VAAITIPGVVANYKKRTLETQFAKVYRTLSQAVNLAVTEHGGIETWDFFEGTSTNEQRVEFVKKYFLPYLNVAKFCPKHEDGGCFTGEYKQKRGAAWGTSSSHAENPDVILADGSMVHFYFHATECIKNNTSCMAFNVDINGTKKPNTFGADLFTFELYPATGEFLPNGINGTYNSETKQYEKNTYEDIVTLCKNKNGSGAQCSALTVLDGFKMNYLD